MKNQTWLKWLSTHLCPVKWARGTLTEPPDVVTKEHWGIPPWYLPRDNLSLSQGGFTACVLKSLDGYLSFLICEPEEKHTSLPGLAWILNEMISLKLSTAPPATSGILGAVGMISLWCRQKGDASPEDNFKAVIKLTKSIVYDPHTSAFLNQSVINTLHLLCWPPPAIPDLDTPLPASDCTSSMRDSALVLLDVMWWWHIIWCSAHRWEALWFLICVQALAVYRMLSQSYVLLILILDLQCRYNCAHLTDEEIEALTGKVPWGHLWKLNTVPPSCFPSSSGLKALSLEIIRREKTERTISAWSSLVEKGDGKCS